MIGPAERRDGAPHPASAGSLLARLHALSDQKPGSIPALSGLTDLADWLSDAAALLSKTPAAVTAVEWLMDNAYAVARAALQIRADLPPGYYARLPALATDNASQPPRVYALAHGIAQATSLQLSADSITRFVSAYQEVATLELAELWALPTMLRLTCIEMLVSSLLRLAPELEAPFAVSHDGEWPLRLDDAECVARCIRGLATLNAIAWSGFVDATSAIDAVLRNDPAGAYPQMDSQTRNAYRRSVEDLARRSHHAESDVARRALAQARRSTDGGRTAHVGFWLVAEGRERLERSLRYRPSWLGRTRRGLRKHATGIYLGALFFLTASFVAVPGLYLARVGASPSVWGAALALLLLPASMLAVTVVHWTLSRILPPTVLPKLDFEAGVPPEYQTAVVIPSLIGSHEAVEDLLRQIERHYLSNPDPNLCFVLLTGFREADEPRLPNDAALLEHAVRGVAELNRRNAGAPSGRFHLLHRERSFNEVEGRWMGWERKRGKLDELNRLILGDDTTGFEAKAGDLASLRGVRFVITLDADTTIPPGAAARLVGTLAHPLNRAEFDPTSGRVRAGYTIVQPRVETSPESGNCSRFSRLYCGDTAIDIYSRAVSDVYQDLFGTGIYVGKAIYDIAAFSRSLDERIPENALASHDLFEGIHGRASLASDIVLYEDYPSNYLAFTRRLHRWVRGDWQLLPWLRERVPGAGYDYLPNRLASIDRWKIIDNLRRSLLPSALLLLIVSGWTWFPGQPLVWTLFAVLVPAGHLFVDFSTGLVRERWRIPPDLSRSLLDDVGRWALLLIFLPHHAAVTADAIVRTLIRVAFTKRHLLEWTTSSQVAAEVTERRPVALVWREMAVAPLLAMATGAALVHWKPAAIWVAAPLLALWALSPEVARRISRPWSPRREQLDPEAIAFLRGIARRTWLFFESYVGPDGHWLPPDNYQDDPGRSVAHRTSPTNIGMLLLATLTAYDLGYVGLEQLVIRLRNTLRTLGRLEHYRGHLFNWYHTRTLEPLLPRYVSTVDSGNLAAALLTVQGACSEMEAAPCLSAHRWAGLADTIALVQEEIPARLGASGAGQASGLGRRAMALYALVQDARDDPGVWAHTLGEVDESCAELESMLLEAVAKSSNQVDALPLGQLRLCLGLVHDHARSMRHDLESLAPWLGVLEAVPSLPEDHPQGPALIQTRAEIAALLPPSIPLGMVPVRCEDASNALAVAREGRLALDHGDEAARKIEGWLRELEHAIAWGAGNAKRLGADLGELAIGAEAEALGMDFGLLYDADARHLFIGYNVTADQMDSHHYDLLASEARLASFVAIAKGDVPPRHWFSLERPLTQAAGGIALLSWGGTMFEYLMPSLLIHSQPGTLLAESQRAAVLVQMGDGQSHGQPWGVSESGFAAFDADHNYQYRAFGVQALGRKRGLDDDRVVAPYAAALALPLFPESALENLERLRDLGMLGILGFYEAIDFTPSRLPEGRDHEIVFSHMSHHQGMILASIDNVLCDDALVRRFGANARVRAVEYFLQERVPGRIPIAEPRLARPQAEGPRSKPPVALLPWRPTPTGARPSLHLLGNGALASRVTDGGGGGLRWREHAVTRCIPDGTLDDAGLWIYVRDQETGATWSVGRQPTGGAGAELDVVFHAHLVELHRRQHGVAIRTDIAIGAADDIEVRRMTIVNETDQPRSLSFTSYGEVVLAPPQDDARHPAFSKLFVEGVHVPRLDALVFARRPRDPEEHFPIVMHRLVAESPAVAFAGFETDRERFLGRNGSLQRPRGLGEDLSATQGATLDPIMAIRAEVNLAPYATEQLAFATLVGPSRQSVDEMAVRFDTLAAFEWLLVDAHTEAAREAGRLGLEAGRLPELQELLSSLLSPRGAQRAEVEELASNRLGQRDLWGFGISGDDPLLLVETTNDGQDAFLGDVIRAHQLWRRRGMAVDVVVLSRAASGYRDDAWDETHRLLRALDSAQWLGRRAGIHLIRADQVSEEQRRLLRASAGAILDADRGPLRDQLAPRGLGSRPLPHLEATRAAGELDAAPALERPRDLLFDNGLGGFSADGREYVIHCGPGEVTPAPWCNVLANEDFGCLVTEAGGGYTWAGNSGEFRLTPWTNDPVLDPAGESLYLRDEETVEVWSPTPGPAGTDLACQIRHGAGYSEWRQNGRGLAVVVRIFVPMNDPVKIVELRVSNHEARQRRLTATYYARWLLGRMPAPGPSHVLVSYDPATRSLYARNPWDGDFADRVAFLTADREPHGLTADRGEFLGLEGDPRAPAALGRVGLSGAAGVGLDPCGVLQIHLDLGPGEEVRAHFVLGGGRDVEHATQLARRWQEPDRVAAASEELTAHWDALLSGVTVRTPEPAMDLLINRWALYQAISSRILARTGFYQSSGAFGFRDQIQDVLALLHCDAPRARAHILECARHQFEEGDVLHWWHPPLGRGVRTRCSDDLLWLPYAVARYVEATGDLAILDQDIPFLSAPGLDPDEHQRYDLFQHGSSRASLFEHCRRALERSLTRGAHGLPLIGDSDWNDGMNRVGSKGRGESVWLGWFAGAAAAGFASLCERLGDLGAATGWRKQAQELFRATDREGWDGAWYRRAFDDEGTPWGSAESDECRIDSIAQSWAVLSGGAPRNRAEQALGSAESALVREGEQLACLLWPPFERTTRDPGYIKAYPPGVRENGGQYNHAAAWLAWAFVAAGDGDRAVRLFRMLNPIERTQSPETVGRYRLEPYVIAGDIASVEPRVGRGGWSWYTGAAAWSWRLGVEAILGIQREGEALRIEPHIPVAWPGFEATVRTRGGVVEIVVEKTQGTRGDTVEITVDGSPIEGNLVESPTKGATRRVLVRVRASKDEA